MNATWAIAVAKAGDEDGSGLIGGSCIVDPNGRIVAQAKTLADEVIVADIDLDLCRQGKDKMFNFAAHRRPEQYRAITERAGVIEPALLDMDLLGELNAASMISKLALQRAEVASAPDLIEAVTATTASLVKRPDLGAIAPGATADLTIIDMTHPHLQPLFDPRRALVALGNRANVDQVIVDGRVLIDAGRYVHEQL